MAKFVVDTETLGYVSRALSALSAEFEGIARMTTGLEPQEVGGAVVIRHLEQFDDSWREGRSVIDEEITGMSRRLAEAQRVYALIERRVAAGARGRIDLGRWGVAHVGGSGDHGAPGSGGHTGTGTRRGAGGRTGTGTTTIGAHGPTAHPGTHPGPRSGTGTTTIGGRGPGAHPGTHAGTGTGTGTTTIGGGPGSGGGGHHSGTGTTRIGGAGQVEVHSRLLTRDQATFASTLAALTGLSPRVVAAWCLAEESGSAADEREAENNNNWLNIGYFDSGRGAISYDRAFEDPTTAAEQTARFLEGSWGGASPGIRRILDAGSDPARQIDAIASSGWASSGYDGGASLRATYDELSGLTVSHAA